MVGETIGNYQFIDRLGRGGIGTVYRALDTTLQREVAIRLLNAELTDPEVARRFHADAVTIARLNHPGIARVYELLEHDNRMLLVMEFVRGETVERMIGRLGPLPPARAADLCLQALDALAHAHGHGVVHRDVSPANLMATGTGAVKIMDFGIAGAVGSEQMTSAGFLPGTPAFMAPEQVTGGEIDARADLYAMGVVLYHLVTAKLPFRGDTPMAVARARLDQDPTPMSELRPNLPAWIAVVTTRALARAPAERFHTAEEFTAALVQGLAGLPLDLSTPTMLPPELMTTLAPGTMPVAPPPATGRATILAAAPDPGSAPLEGLLPVPGPALAPPSPAVPPPVHRWSIPRVAALAGVLSLIAGFFVVRQLWPADPAPPAEAAGIIDNGQTAVMPPFPSGAAPEVPATGLVAERDGVPERGLRAETPPTPAGPGPDSTSASPPAAPASGRSGAPALPGAAGAVSPGPIEPSRSGSGRTGRPGDEPVVFEDAKLMTVSGRAASDRDVLIRVGRGAIIAIDRTTGEMFGSMGYADLVGGTYVKARSPKWDATLAAPPDNLGLPGGFLGLRPSRHWLVLQGRRSYLMLVLADAQFVTVLDLITRRTGKPIARPVQVP